MQPSRLFFFIIPLVVLGAFLSACSDDDDFTTSPTAILSFSTDSVKMDTVFATVGSRTYDFWVYNHSRAGLHIKSVRLKRGNQTGFRVNVDGSYLDNSTGAVINDLEVRKGDSIRVFVELTSPQFPDTSAPVQIDDDLLFLLESGVEQRVCLRGYSWDALLWHNPVISADSVIESSKPIVIYGGLRVDSTATLLISNTTLFFHQDAGLDVYGTVKAENSVFRGDRLDHMFDYLPYDRISGQWRGVTIHSSSFGNMFVGSEIRNADNGIVCDSAAFTADRQRLYMERSVIHNCKGHGIRAFNTSIGLLRCQITNTQGDCLAVYGGLCVVDQCTLAQFYPFVGGRGAALRFANYYQDYAYPLERFQMTGSIVTGYADDVVMGEARADDSLTLFSYYFENSLLRTVQVMTGKPEVPDTVNFVNVRWESPKDSIQGKQHFRRIDEDSLIYDFHLDSLSTAHGLGCY